MVDYVLSYGQPRCAAGGAGVIYESRFLRVKRDDDAMAIHWANEVVPYEFGVTCSGKKYLASPMELRRLVSPSHAVIWKQNR